MDSVSDGLHQIGGHLARLEGKDHVRGHGVVLEFGIGHAVLNQFFIKDCSLDSDWKSVEVLDSLELACIDGCGKECGDCKEQNHKENNNLLHVHSSTHLKLMSI